MGVEEDAASQEKECRNLELYMKERNIQGGDEEAGKIIEVSNEAKMMLEDSENKEKETVEELTKRTKALKKRKQMRYSSREC